MNPPPKIKWKWLYILTGGIDLVQIAIDFIPLIGPIINEIIDPVIGFLLALLFWYKRILDVVGGIGFFVAILAKEGTLGAAPAWVAVTGLVHFNYLKNKILPSVPGKTGPAPLNQNGVRKPPVIASNLNKDGVRAPNRAPNKDLAPLVKEPEVPRKIVPLRAKERSDIDMAT